MVLTFRLNENPSHVSYRLALVNLPKKAKQGAGAATDFQHTRLSMASQSTCATQILHRHIDRQGYGRTTRLNAVDLLHRCLFAR